MSKGTRNLFLLVIDSLRADSLLADFVPTPNLGRFTDEGAVFYQCICTAPLTSPSFASMLTGCYPPKHGVRRLKRVRLSDSVETLAEVLRAGGYETHAEVTGPLFPETGILRGFEDVRHRHSRRQRFHWRDDVIARMRTYGKPWFLMLHVFELHFPFQVPPDLTPRWGRPGYELALNALDDYLVPIFEAVGGDALVVITGDHGEEYPETDAGTRLRAAARLIRRRLGKRSRYLSRKLLRQIAGHGFGLSEQAVRVPLVVSGPGVGRCDVSQQVRHIDLLPTLCELCGLPAPAVDGRSLEPLMSGGGLPEAPAYIEAAAADEAEDEDYFERHRISGARTEGWKLLRYGTGESVLLDLEGAYRWDGSSRPESGTNLYSERPDIARQLEGYVSQVLASETRTESGLSEEEEVLVEEQLRDLGYL